MKTNYTKAIKYLVCSIAGCLILVNNTFAQSQPEQDCINAIPICQNQYATSLSYTGGGNNPNEIDTTISCLKEGEKNDVWYTFTVQAGGNLKFIITPNDPLDDYDWAVFNLTGAKCSDIFNNAALSVSCNYSQDPGPTGPNGANSQTSATWMDPHFNAAIPVLAGQTYAINVSNFSSTQSGYGIDFGASTAQIFDNVAPQMTSVNQPSGCGASNVTFNFSENIVFTSVQDADFTLTGPNGTYLVSGWSSPSQMLGSNYGNGFTVNVSPAMVSGNYTLNLTNNSGSVTDLCGNVALPSSLNFTVSGITATIAASDVLCNGGNNGSAVVNPSSGTAPYSFNWSNGATGISTGALLSIGSYTVTVTDVNGCSTSVVATINEPLAMILSESHTDVKCFGDNNGTATISVLGGTPVYTYTFNSQAGSSSTATNLAAGLNQVTVSDINGCQASIQFTINQPAAIVSAISSSVSDTICSGSHVSLSVQASGGAPGYSYNWNNGTYFEDSIIVNPGTTTVYTVTATDSNGCTSQQQSVTVYVYDALNINYTAPAACQGQLVSLDLSATGGNGQYTFNLMPGNLSGNHFTLSADSSQAYIATVYDGCQSFQLTDTIRFTVYPLPVTNFTMDVNEGCAPLCINFTDNSTIASGSVASWNWDLLDSSSSEQNPSQCFMIKGVHKIKLVAVSDHGCFGDTVEQKIKVYAQPVAQFSADKEKKSVFHASFNFKDESVNAVSWIWNFGDINDPTVKTIKNPTHTYSDTGSYTVTLVVFNAKGCSDTITQIVEVFPVSKMFLPDAFSPNGDGINDVFSLKGLYVSALDLTIFDRWGKTVAQLGSVNDSWDGTINGTELPIGIYSYVANIQGADGKRMAQDGIITLVR